MKKLLLAFILSGLCITGLQAQDRLQPAKSVFDTYPHSLDYSKALQKNLLGAEEENRLFLFKYFVCPSFSQEYFLGLIRQDETYYLVYRIPKKSVWGTRKKEMDGAAVGLQEIRREVSPDSGELLQRLIFKAVLSAEFPKPVIISQIINGDTLKSRLITSGYDGTNYYFSIWDYGKYTATVWSPDKGSKTEALVDIFEEVIACVRNSGKGTTVELDSTLKNRIAKLTSGW